MEARAPEPPLPRSEEDLLNLLEDADRAGVTPVRRRARAQRHVGCAHPTDRWSFPLRLAGTLQGLAFRLTHLDGRWWRAFVRHYDRGAFEACSGTERGSLLKAWHIIGQDVLDGLLEEERDGCLDGFRAWRERTGSLRQARVGWSVAVGRAPVGLGWAAAVHTIDTLLRPAWGPHGARPALDPSTANTVGGVHGARRLWMRGLSLLEQLEQRREDARMEETWGALHETDARRVADIGALFDALAARVARHLPTRGADAAEALANIDAYDRAHVIHLLQSFDALSRRMLGCDALWAGVAADARAMARRRGFVVARDRRVLRQAAGLRAWRSAATEHSGRRM